MDPRSWAFFPHSEMILPNPHDPKAQVVNGLKVKIVRRKPRAAFRTSVGK